MMKYTDMDELRHARINNFKNVITGKGKIDHIPHFGNYWSWKYYDTGYVLSEALFDYKKMEAAILEFAKRYPMDVIYETGWRNPVQLTSMLGKKNDYTFNDEMHTISVLDQDNMEDDEYESLIENPVKYLWEEFIPGKYSALKGDNSSAAMGAYLQGIGQFGGAMGSIMGALATVGVPDLFDQDAAFDAWGFGYELLFNCMRGMKKLSIDLRRRPDQLEEACRALDELFEEPRIRKGMAGSDGSNPEFCVDISPVMLGHVILNVKQFERFYLPHLKKINDYLVNKDKIAFFFVEGSLKRFWDIFKDFPADRIGLMMELDDIFETNDALPNIVIGGGMPAALLGGATPEECVEYTKKLIDRLGADDHRYIFAPDKMISYPNDCSRENLKAICSYLEQIQY